MQESTYFVFSLAQKRYGINRDFIEEVFLLPDFQMIPDAPYSLVGAINLRGIPLPVLDLQTEPGQTETTYRLADKVVVLRCFDQRVGLVVHRIHEEVTVAPEEMAIEYADEQRLTRGVRREMIAGSISRAEGVVLLRDPEDWFEKPALLDALDAIAHQFFTSTNEATLDHAAPSNSFSVFSQAATAQERTLFRERAERLGRSLQQQEVKESKPVAVIDLSGQVWGIRLESVREFIDIRSLTPIPCCPPHIIGNTNYRSEILTLIDIRAALNLPLPAALGRFKVMVVETESVMAGILVDEVYDAMFAPNSEDRALNTAANERLQNPYLWSTTQYGARTMGILDISKILSSPEFQVDEFL